ncbi:MAG TPA: hypothetical protein VM938_13835 [Acidimicrobiales bacterium]|nr:hypothetical protein [Acidimicrobiales bacterium]
MCPSKSTPTPEEVAAVVAAIEMTWPRPVVAVPSTERPQAWRFSGRWWLSGTPVAAQRRRP